MAQFEIPPPHPKKNHNKNGESATDHCAALGFRPEPAEEDDPSQRRPQLRGHIRGRLQHPGREYRNTRPLL